MTLAAIDLCVYSHVCKLARIQFRRRKYQWWGSREKLRSEREASCPRKFLGKSMKCSH
jgi:hypothetical protein